jgi:hypothetical protein
MLSKCLNSHCSATFHHLGQGRLFRVDFSDVGRKRAMAGKPVVISKRSKTHPVEHFWLCESCATRLTIVLSDAGEVCLMPYDEATQKHPAEAVRDTRKFAAAAS